MALTVGGLFSGIGALELGLERAGFEIAFHSEIDPYARKILRKNWPRVPLWGDIRKLGAHCLPRVDLLCGGFPCFVAGTMIETEGGTKAIEDIREGEWVWTHEKRLRRVIRTVRRTGAPIVEVKAMGAPPIETTSEHPFLARLRGRRWNNEIRRYERTFGPPAWVPASELTRDHFVAQPCRLGKVRGAGRSVHFWYLIGRWLGDGWVVDHPRKSKIPQGQRGSRVNSRMRKAIICCAHEEADELDRRIRAAGFHATRAPERTAVKFHITSKDLVEFLGPFGRGAKNKRIPGFVLAQPKHILESVWNGLLDSDGCIDTENGERINSISKELMINATRLRRIIDLAPVSLSKHTPPEHTVIEGRSVRQQAGYVIRASKPRNPGERGTEGFVEHGLCWVPVRSVKATGAIKEVFNLEVEDDNSYIADSLVVHNCQSVSIAGRRQGIASGTASGLWSEYARLIRDLRPRFVLVENTPGLLSLDFGRVLGDLAESGYDSEWDCFPAAAVGAPHLRDRVYVVAYAQQNGLRKQSIAIDWSDGPTVAPVDGEVGTPSDADRERLEEQRRGEPIPKELPPLNALLPTLTRKGNDNRKGLSAKSGDGLPARLRTLQRRDSRGASSPEDRMAGGHSIGLNDRLGGRLSPTWCEWFMGLPLGWTELPESLASRVSATRSCRKSRSGSGAASSPRWRLNLLGDKT